MPLEEGRGSAVRAGPDFENWAVVDRHGRCQTCTRGSACGHASGEQAPAAVEALSAAMSQANLDKEYNPQEEARKLHCRMTAARHLREDPNDNPPEICEVERGVFLQYLAQIRTDSRGQSVLQGYIATYAMLKILNPKPAGGCLFGLSPCVDLSSRPSALE